MIIVLGNFAHMQKSVFPRLARRMGLKLEFYPDPERIKARLDQIIFWNPFSVLCLHRDDYIETLYGAYFRRGRKIVNQDFVGCNKLTLDRHFKEVTGRTVQVGPQHNGPIVVKSIVNSRHDGRIYQAGQLDQVADHQFTSRLINNVAEDDRFVEDFRIHICGDQICPIGWKKWRPKNRRFGTQADKAWVIPTRMYLSPEEMSQILQVAQALKLDFGEMDVLRDRDTGYFWVVDVNNCPYAIRKEAAGKTETEKGHDILARTYREAFKLPTP